MLGQLARLSIDPRSTGFRSSSSSLSGEKPVQAVLLLMHRIERWETAESPLAYRPLPYRWSHPLQVRSSLDLLQILSDIRGWLSEKTDSWMRPGCRWAPLRRRR